MITPYILGSGGSGQAVAKTLSILSTMYPELGLGQVEWITRGATLRSAIKDPSNSILCISNPHGLHAATLLEADGLGLKAILCEKPACVNLDEIKQLRGIKTLTGILHVYRQTWGLQTLKKMLGDQGDAGFGELISIEGRYWQSSAAERALSKTKTDPKKAWKNDPSLSGAYDVYLDLATHWIDAVSFLIGETPKQIQAWRTHINSDLAHRDSHVQLTARYPNQARAMASVSKTVHGATNQFEIHVLGAKRSATWRFLNPDEIEIGEGKDRRVVTRASSELGSKQWPHHGMGWLEGYLEITLRLLREAMQGDKSAYPKLSDNLDLLSVMFQTEWST